MKTPDDIKLEIAIEAETSLFSAARMVRKHFPMAGSNISDAFRAAIKIYEECNGKPYPGKEKYRF